MADNASIGHEAHPAPHRDRARLAELTFATIAPPLAWSLHLIFNYALASHSCFPDGAPLVSYLAGIRPLLVAADVAGLAVSVVATFLGYRIWRATRQEMAEPAPPMIETGEGRTRFLGIWGVLIGLGFVLAIVFDSVALWILPICS
jgi:hypothetical protein